MEEDVDFDEQDRASAVPLPRCRACGSVLEAGAGFCSECGESVTPGRRSGRQRSERKQASMELIRAAKFLRLLRNFYLFNAVLNGIAAAFSLHLLALDLFPLGIAVLTFAMLVGITALLVMGAIRLRYRPFLWAVTLACLVTVSRILGAYNSDFSTFSILFGVVWAGAFWAMTVPVSRVRRLIEEHPDLAITKSILGTGARGRKSPEELAHLNALAEQRANRRSLVAAAIILVLGAVAGFTSYSVGRTPSLDASWKDFVADWRSGEAERVAEWFAASERDEKLRWLRAVEEHRGWTGAWPLSADLEDGEIPEDALVFLDSGTITDEDFPTGAASWRWSAADGPWTLTAIVLPDPPADDTIAAFEAALERVGLRRPRRLLPGPGEDGRQLALDGPPPRLGELAGDGVAALRPADLRRPTRCLRRNRRRPGADPLETGGRPLDRLLDQASAAMSRMGAHG